MPIIPNIKAFIPLPLCPQTDHQGKTAGLPLNKGSPAFSVWLPVMPKTSDGCRNAPKCADITREILPDCDPKVKRGKT
jgi:hypothetical protein